MDADPITSLNEMALTIHELYTSWIGAGFTAEQALELVKALVAAQARP